MNLQQALARCRHHLPRAAEMESSARLCLADAVRLHDDGDYAGAWDRAAKCLKYCVGIFHKDYQAADLAAKLSANRL